MKKYSSLIWASLCLLPTLAMAQGQLHCQSYGLAQTEGIDHLLSQQEVQQETQKKRVGFHYKVVCTYSTPSLADAYTAFLNNEQYGLKNRELPLIAQLPTKNHTTHNEKKGSTPEGFDDVSEDVSFIWLSPNKVRMEIAGTDMNWYQHNIEFERTGKAVNIIGKWYAP